MKRQLVSLGLLVLVLTIAVSAFAANPNIATGDSRNINSAPAYPATCTTISATGSDQTSAIQSALSSCAGKGAVVLASSGSNTTVSSKGLTIGANEALEINSGVTLLGSSYST